MVVVHLGDDRLGQERVALLAEGELGEAAVQLHGEDELVQRVHLLRLQDRHPGAEVVIQLALLPRKYTAEIMGPPWWSQNEFHEKFQV